MDPQIPFDPEQRAAEAEKAVMNGGARLYHRFRAAPYYGGIATADSVGCCFLCAFCWSYGRNLDPARAGRFYPVEKAADNLLRIAEGRGFRLFRVTGSEPILGEESLRHLLALMDFVARESPRSIFILETNGFMLGRHLEWCHAFCRPNIRVRVSLKGTDPESFERVTGARREFFHSPINALVKLRRLGVDAWPAIMAGLFSRDQVLGLQKTLQAAGLTSPLEEEILEPYGFVLENLRKRGMTVSNNGED
jgi:uncharacterized Fe-S cluster-containing radical SAM superfamily protein